MCGYERRARACCEVRRQTWGRGTLEDSQAPHTNLSAGLSMIWFTDGHQVAVVHGGGVQLTKHLGPDGQGLGVRLRPSRHRRRNPRRRADGACRPREQSPLSRRSASRASPPSASRAATATSFARARKKPTRTSASSARSPRLTPSWLEAIWKMGAVPVISFYRPRL